MQKVSLTRGKSCLVDDEDLHWFKEYSFYCAKIGGLYKVQANSFGKPRTTVILARLIMNAPRGVMVDHINGNPLDNRRINLRLCSNAENCRNRKRAHKTKTRSAKFKGVHKVENKYVAQICFNYKRIYLGKYDTAKAAALAYNKAAVAYFGDFAHINNVRSQ